MLRVKERVVEMVEWQVWLVWRPVEINGLPAWREVHTASLPSLDDAWRTLCSVPGRRSDRDARIRLVLLGPQPRPRSTRLLSSLLAAGVTRRCVREGRLKWSISTECVLVYCGYWESGIDGQGFWFVSLDGEDVWR